MGVNLKKISHIILFVLIIPLFSVVLSYLTSNIIGALSLSKYIFLIDTAGPFGYYALLYSIFDKYLWKLIPSWLNLVEVPNFEGRWAGELKSSYNKKQKPYQCAVEIIQTFSDIKIFCYFSHSWSRSIIAGFSKEYDGKNILRYEYYNEPYEGVIKTMHGHYGSSKHYYEGSTMKCFYFNEPEHNRGRHGNFIVSFKQKELIKKL